MLKNTQGGMIMSFKDIAGSNILWTCVIIGIIIVTLLTVYYLRISYKNALELGIDKKTLKAVIKSSATLISSFFPPNNSQTASACV